MNHQKVAFVPAFVFSLVLASACLAAPAPPAPAIAAESIENWYRMTIDDTPAGWMMTREERRGDQRLTSSETELVLSRGQQEVTMSIASRFTESADGQPISGFLRQGLAGQPMETTYTFEGDVVTISNRQNGNVVGVRETALPAGEWLTPGRAADYVAERALAGDDEITVTTLDLQVGLRPVEIRWVRQGEDTLTIDGEPLATTRWAQAVDAMAGMVSTVHLDGEGSIVRTETSLMGIALSATRTSKDIALGTASEAPELLTRSLITPSKPIAAPRKTRQASYRLHLVPGADLDTLSNANIPSVGHQRVETEENTIRVTVDLDGPPVTAEPLSTAERERHLRATPFLDHTSPEIRELIGPALADTSDDPRARAEALRTFVHGHLEIRNLDTLLATATEVAATRRGDCTEHAVLLAAMLRGADLPSRVAVGLVFVDTFAGATDVFGYHMWTQVWIDDHWLDLDAVFATPFDATHITLGSSPLDEENSALLDTMDVLPLIGSLEIDVLETEK
ncbi:MAG: transglutaminase domain-containing protein [Acidobacteriota bacterium]